MAEIGSAYVALIPSAKGFGSKTETALKPEMAKSGSSLGSVFGKAFAAVGGALIAGKVGQFVKDSTEGYREHLKVVALTNQVIKTTGGAANVSAKGLGTLTDALERKTGVDGDAIQSGANLLLTFTQVQNGVGKNNQIFDQATRAITDMGVALGSDPKASAIQLGKALNDPIKGVTALSRVGVSFTEKQKAVIKTMVESGNVMGAQKIILGELKNEFGGAAKAAATPAQKAAAAYHQLQDEVGKTTVPVMNRLENIFTNKIAPVLMTTAQKYLPKVRKALLGLLDGKKVGTIMSGVGDSLAGINWNKTGTGLQSIGDGLAKVDWDSLKDSLGSGINDTLSVFGVLIGFAADHVDTLAKYLPVLVGAFVAYKVAQTAAHTVALASLPVTLLNAAANIVLASSNRKLAAATVQQTAATVGGTVAGEVSLVSRIAQTVATVAYSVASGIATAATWALNAAIAVLTSPITLVIIAVLLVIGALVLLYKKSDTFRAIVNGAWDAVKAGAELMWNVLKGVFSKIGGAIHTLGQAATWLWDHAFRPAIQFIVRGVATLLSIWATMLHGLGKVPGFDWADDAADALQGVADKALGVVSAMDKIDENKRITITTDYRHTGTPSTGGRVLPGAAKGARVTHGQLMLVGEGHQPESIIPDNLMVRALSTAARGGAGLVPRSEPSAMPRNLRLVVDGHEFNAYVDARADDRLSSASDLDSERGRAAW